MSLSLERKAATISTVSSACLDKICVARKEKAPSVIKVVMEFKIIRLKFVCRLQQLLLKLCTTQLQKLYFRLGLSWSLVHNSLPSRWQAASEWSITQGCPPAWRVRLVTPWCTASGFTSSEINLVLTHLHSCNPRGLASDNTKTQSGHVFYCFRGQLLSWWQLCPTDTLALLMWPLHNKLQSQHIHLEIIRLEVSPKVSALETLTYLFNIKTIETSLNNKAERVQ